MQKRLKTGFRKLQAPPSLPPYPISLITPYYHGNSPGIGGGPLPSNAASIA